MKRTLSLTALACTMAIGLAAQAPTPSAGGAQSSASADAKTKVTVTGCLEKSTPSPTGTAGSTASTEAADTTKFVLKNVMADASATGATPGAAGTTGSAKATASSYRLDADDAKLTAHVGHKVEIVGTVDPMSESATAGAATSASASGPKLKVDSVRMISATCTPQ